MLVQHNSNFATFEKHQLPTNITENHVNINVQSFSIKYNKMYVIQTGKFIQNLISSEGKILLRTRDSI